MKSFPEDVSSKLKSSYYKEGITLNKTKNIPIEFFIRKKTRMVKYLDENGICRIRPL